MLDKLRFSPRLFAHSHNVAEGTILQMKKQGLGSHKIPCFWSGLCAHTYCDFTKCTFFSSLATLDHTRQAKWH